MNESDLLRRRSEFPILQKCVYLVSHSMGAMPRRAYAMLKQYADEWANRGVQAYDDWLPRLRETGDAVGRIINAPPNSVILHQNVSTLAAIVLSALLRPGGRSRIVSTDLNFPSVLYNFSAQAALVRSPDGITIPTEKFVRAIDERTLAVVIDHGIFRSGYLQDVKAITRAAHAKGAYAIVDAYQTIGCVPVDVRDWDADFVLGGSHKWLCGGPGAAFLYVNPRLRPEPRITGWFSHKRPFAFELEMEFADGAMRFATGTPSVPALFAARAGIDTIAEIGVDRIRAKSLRQTRRIMDLAEERGLRVHTPRESSSRGGVVCLDFPGAGRAEARFLRRGIQVDYRPRCGLRVSPHFYTTDDEIDALFSELRR